MQQDFSDHYYYSDFSHIIKGYDSCTHLNLPDTVFVF